MLRKFLFVHCLTFLSPALLQARPATVSDVHSSAFVTEKVWVKKDFSFTKESLVCQRLLDDSDEAISLGSVNYQVDLGLTTVLELQAWTEVQGKKIPVAAENIHKGNAASSLSGFSDIDQYTISFAQVQKGARVCFQVKSENRPSLKGYFEYQITTSHVYMEKNSKMEVFSELPLKVVRRDPSNVTQWKTGKQGAWHSYRASLENLVFAILYFST